MAVLDEQDNTIVINVVYDGPPEAGKTTSIRALGASLGRQVRTPAEENGRTVYFDWMEYIGGRFDGRQIRCQVATVPGQKTRAQRRAHLLSAADVVIFVGDSSAGAWAETRGHLRELRRMLDDRGKPSVGIVFQANKRDRPDALPIEEVRAHLAEQRIGVIESVASENTGIREAFVLSVRLALDRVRELQRLGRLPPGNPAVGHEDELLAALRRLDEEAQPREVFVPHGPTPRPPSADAPMGVMWPPVDGRTILHEVSALGVRTRVTDRGDCVAGLGIGWRLHSSASAVFGRMDDGRAVLVRWARLHASARDFLSGNRCIVLAEDGRGGWRLWQIVRAQASLREMLLEDDGQWDAGAVAQRIALATRTLLDASRLRRAYNLPLSCTISTIGLSASRAPVYVGLMPEPDQVVEDEPDGESVAQELAELFRDRHDAERGAIGEALRQVSGSAFSFGEGPRVSELLTRLLAS